MPVSYGRGIKKKCIVLHSKIIRSAGVCHLCGENYYSRLDCAHLISRVFAATVADLRNGVCLCKTCHWRTGVFADEMGKLIETTIGWGVYGELKDLAESKKKVRWKQLHEELRTKAKELDL